MAEAVVVEGGLWVPILCAEAEWVGIGVGSCGADGIAERVVFVVGGEVAVGGVGQGLGRDVGGEAAGILLHHFGDVAVGVVGEAVGSGVGSAVFFYAEQAADAARALEAPGEVESPCVGLEEGVATGGIIDGDQVAECSPEGRPLIRSCGRKQSLRHLRAAALRPAIIEELFVGGDGVGAAVPPGDGFLDAPPLVVVFELDLLGSGGQRGNGLHLLQAILGGPGEVAGAIAGQVAVGVVVEGLGPGGEVLVQRVGGVGLADPGDAGAEAVADVVKAIIKDVRGDWTAGVRRRGAEVAVGTHDATLAEHARHKPQIHRTGNSQILFATLAPSFLPTQRSDSGVAIHWKR